MKLDGRRLMPAILIALLMAVTVGHVASFAGSYEPAGWQWLGWPYAVAVDLAIAICAYFTRWKTTRFWAWAGYFAFIAASGALNVAHIQPVEIATWIYALFPTAAIALLGFLSRDVDALAAHSGRGKRRKSGHNANASQQELDTSQSIASSQLFACQVCGQSFGSQPALNAHQRIHKRDNGKGSQQEAIEMLAEVAA